MGMNTRIAGIVAEMTLEEKVSLCTGGSFWTTTSIDRLKIPSLFMTDGPHGLRKATDGMLNATVPATCFPTASALASSWNRTLLRDIGVAIGEEAQTNDVQVVLGPGINMKRSPLAGRNFEYFSEDPYLSGTLAASYIDGVQSTGTGTSLKHFVANEQEFERMASDSIIDERTLHEIYLRAFEIAIAAQPWSIMCAYNKINGMHASENYELLINVLRERWGYDGIVISDWGAVYDVVESIKNGLQLEMPGSPATPQKLIDAIERGQLSEETLDRSVYKLLNAILQVHNAKIVSASYDKNAHHQLARRAASESVVLLKNTGEILPLSPGKNQHITIVGRFAKQPRYQGSGSSQVTPTILADAWTEFTRVYGDSQVSYAAGYRNDGSTSEKLINEALKMASKSSTTIVFAGLPDNYESEGFDRQTIALPDGHNQLIDRLVAANERVIVVLMNGAAVTMPWIHEAHAVLEGWLSGQAGGQAIVDIISGTTTPSGKLSETFAVRIEDTPPYPDFPARNEVARYSEGILVGYRHYDAHAIKPLFPFGFGLSYTTFAYSDMRLDSTHIKDDETLMVTIKVKNTGKYTGQEVVQLYVTDTTTHALHAPRDLRRYTKIMLEPNEIKTVVFRLDRRCFAYYDPNMKDWRVDPGAFTIAIGSSSRDLRTAQDVMIAVPYERRPQITRDSLLKEFASHPRGKAFYSLIMGKAQKTLGQGDTNLVQHVIDDMPLAKIGVLSGGLINDDLVDAIVTYCQHPHSLNPFYALPLIKEASKMASSQLFNRKK